MYLYFFYFNKNHGATSFNLLSFHFYFYFFRSAASPTSLFVGSSSSFFISCFLVFWWFSCYFPYPVWIQECFVNKQVIPLNKKSGNTLFFIFLVVSISTDCAFSVPSVLDYRVNILHVLFYSYQRAIP